MGLALLNIPTVDFEKSLPFYAQLLGIDPDQFIKNSQSYVEQFYYPVSGDGIDFAISHKNDPRSTTTSYFTVDDLDRTIESLHEAGGELAMPPREMKSESEKEGVPPFGRTAVMVDPDGNYVGLIEFSSEEGKRYFSPQGSGEEASEALRERIELARQGTSAG